MYRCGESAGAAARVSIRGALPAQECSSTVDGRRRARVRGAKSEVYHGAQRNPPVFGQRAIVDPSAAIRKE
jgi:hypothetical protein